MPTIKDVSRKAGVSRSTVSRLIAGTGYVSDAARAAVERAIEELGYRPSTLARGLRSNRSNMIGAVVVDVASPFYAQMVGGMQRGARAGGRSVLVASGYADRDEEAHAVIELIDRACDGLILYLENPMRDDVVRLIGKSKTPIVTIGGDESPVATAKIRIDNFGGARAAMRLLLESGHRRIAYLSGGLKYRDTHERLRGITAALGEAGLSLDDITLVHGDFVESFGYRATTALLTGRKTHTAIMAGDDDIAAGALAALKAAGKRVPGDLSLVGFDDNFHARHLTPALTTVRQPVDDVGYAAAALLNDILAGRDPGQREIMTDTELIVRDSVGRPARTGSRKEAGEVAP
jgi:LacI family transcriptional regulator